VAVDARTCDGKVLLGSEHLQVLGSQQFAAGHDVALGQLRRFLKTLQPNICQDEGAAYLKAPLDHPWDPRFHLGKKFLQQFGGAVIVLRGSVPEGPPRNDLQFVHGNHLFEPLKQNAQV
jgi:hypothetical protein